MSWTFSHGAQTRQMSDFYGVANSRETLIKTVNVTQLFEKLWKQIINHDNFLFISISVGVCLFLIIFANFLAEKFGEYRSHRGMERCVSMVYPSDLTIVHNSSPPSEYQSPHPPLQSAMPDVDTPLQPITLVTITEVEEERHLSKTPH